MSTASFSIDFQDSDLLILCKSSVSILQSCLLSGQASKTSRNAARRRSNTRESWMGSEASVRKASPFVLSRQTCKAKEERTVRLVNDRYILTEKAFEV